MNMQELKAAAERLVLHGETLGGSGNPYSDPSVPRVQFDEIAVGEFVLSLLSDEPVTADWLREKWGFKDIDIDYLRLDGISDRYGDDVFVSWFGDGHFSIGDEHFDIDYRGQFTMLCYALGLTPKEITNG